MTKPWLHVTFGNVLGELYMLHGMFFKNRNISAAFSLVCCMEQFSKNSLQQSNFHAYQILHASCKNWWTREKCQATNKNCKILSRSNRDSVTTPGFNHWMKMELIFRATVKSSISWPKKLTLLFLEENQKHTFCMVYNSPPTNEALDGLTFHFFATTCLLTQTANDMLRQVFKKLKSGR